MKNVTNKRIFAKLGLQFLGYLLCIVPPIVCTLSYFPLWRSAEKSVSVAVLVLILIAALPLYKLVKEKLKSPASYTVWLLLFILFFTLSKIAAEMTVISFVGFIGNALGAVFFAGARRLGGVKNGE